VHELRDLPFLARQHLADQRLAGLRRQEPVVGHPVVVEDLGQVAAAAVGQQDHDHVVRTGPVRGLQRGHHGQPAGPADQQRLLPGQPPRHTEALGVGDRDHLVADGAVVGDRPDVLADPLDQIGTAGTAGVHRTLGVGPDDLHPAVRDLLQVPAGATDRPAGADSGYEVGDTPVGLGPDLRPRRRVVRRGVVRIGVLVGLPGPGQLGRHPAGHAVVGVGVLGRHRTRADHHVRAVRPEHADLVLRHLVRADEHALVATFGGHDG
jgi:hypothetical protein